MCASRQTWVYLCLLHVMSTQHNSCTMPEPKSYRHNKQHLNPWWNQRALCAEASGFYPFPLLMNLQEPIMVPSSFLSSMVHGGIEICGAWSLHRLSPRGLEAWEMHPPSRHFLFLDVIFSFLHYHLSSMDILLFHILSITSQHLAFPKIYFHIISINICS